MAHTNKHIFLAHRFGFGIWTKIKWKNQNCPFIQQLIMLKKKCKIMPQDRQNQIKSTWCSILAMLISLEFLHQFSKTIVFIHLFIKYWAYVLFAQSLSPVRHFVAPWTATRQASLFFTVFHSLLKLMSIESVMPSNHLIFCWPLLILPSIFPSIRIFSDKLAVCIRWPK